MTKATGCKYIVCALSTMGLSQKYTNTVLQAWKPILRHSNANSSRKEVVYVPDFQVGHSGVKRAVPNKLKQ